MIPGAGSARTQADPGGFGGRSMTAPLRRALLRAPEPEELAAWADYGWLSAPDPAAASREHEAFADLLRESGVDVHIARHAVPGDPDAIYVCDPALLREDGVFLLRPGKPGRREEPHALRLDLEDLGIPVTSEMAEPATAEGGDLVWIDEDTLLVGRGLRTNAAGVAALRDSFPDADVIAFDLPYAKGPESCFHLMSLISPLDRDLVVAYTPLMPVALMELLDDRGIHVVPVPDEEFESMGPNVLAVAPRLAIALEGNPTTRRRMEAAGVGVSAYAGEHISRRGEGGPTCLTRALLRSE
jgi:dimethylargininase